MRTDPRPIGVFDSGLGGLTVARAIRAAAPGEAMVYLGDTARVPYGTRSAATVVRYAQSCARQLRRHDIKLLVVACNTVSAVALDMLRAELDVPVMGVIEPGARAGVEACAGGPLGVVATAGTIASGAYVRAVGSIDSRVTVLARPAPLLVPLVEEGWTEGEVPRLVLRRYLEPFREAEIAALILGCTHYPVLGALIRREVAALCGPRTHVVDSAEATADELLATLADRGLRAGSSRIGSLRLLVTDLPQRFTEEASRFLGQDAGGLEVEQIDL